MTTSWSTIQQCFLKTLELKSQHLRRGEERGSIYWDGSPENGCVCASKRWNWVSDHGGKPWVGAREAVKGKGPLGDGGIEMGRHGCRLWLDSQAKGLSHLTFWGLVSCGAVAGQLSGPMAVCSCVNLGWILLWFEKTKKKKKHPSCYF